MNYQGMDTQELNQEIGRLLAVKKKNEEKIPEGQLQTKYKNSYGRLCQSLREAQCELRARYAGILRGLTEAMADSVYMDPEDKPRLLDLKLNEERDLQGRDPLAEALYIAFYHNYFRRSSYD